MEGGYQWLGRGLGLTWVRRGLAASWPTCFFRGFQVAPVMARAL